MKPGDVRICPSCQARNKPKWEFCVKCGEALDDVPVASSGPGAGKASVRVKAMPREEVRGGVPWLALVGLVGMGAAVWFGLQAARSPERRTEGSAASAPPLLNLPPATGAPAGAGQAAEAPAAVAALEAARAALNRGDDAAALPHLAQAVAEAPDNAEAHYLYAGALGRTGSPGEALAQFREAARLQPRTLYRADLAKALAIAGQRDEAIETYESVLADEPRSPAYLQQLARLYKEAGTPDRGLELLTRAAEIAPLRADLQEETAFALEQSGRTEEAMATYRKALDADAKSVVSRARLAELMFKQGQKAEAVSLVRGGLEQAPDAADLHKSLGGLLERSGDARAAAMAYREYARLAPEAPDAAKARERAAQLEGRANPGS
jgi:tetratricopeptide (TPR) repeat protein